YHVERITMIYSGQSVTVELLDDGIAELKFDLQGESVNKFDRGTLEDLGKAIDAVKANNDVKASSLPPAKKYLLLVPTSPNSPTCLSFVRKKLQDGALTQTAYLTPLKTSQYPPFVQ